MSVVPPNLHAALSGRYRIGREIGRGGMATVYLAEDLKHARQVAVKVLDPRLATEISPQRFLREIEIVARLTHPHIVPLFDSGAEGSLLYYVMPFVEGESLRARLVRERRLPVEEALRLAHEVASALAHAHARGLVHRDIKPENILISGGIAQVVDFGLARVRHDPDVPSLMTPGFLIGTPLYMSPEQVRGDSGLDGRADLYSLACVLYEMLAGEPPFSGSTPGAIIHQHLSIEPRLVTELRPAVPGAVAAALGKALAKRREERYATAARFAEALRIAMTGARTAWHPASRVPTNLPRPLTSFVGREQELAECERLLGEARLLTMTGVGGCGKTRLAIKLAEHALPEYPDGVWFVDLGPLAEGERVAQAAAAVMGVREEPGTPVMETLVHFAAHRVGLLLLDNCEHLRAACASLSNALLAASAEIRLVATSREALGVPGEHIYAVGPLPVPKRGEERDLGRVEVAGSVRLFADRARMVAPDFRLTEENAPVVAEICRRLDGIPLALELAAARMKVLSPEQIHSKLDNRFRLLTGGVKTALPRHQTLRATIQWSHDLLSTEEQDLFRMLSVFSDGWTLEGATVVGGDGGDFEVMDRLTRLVDKSLVMVERLAGTEPRYRMLETVRQYAQDRLEEAGEAGAARTRHLDFYLAMAEEAEPKLYGPEQADWLRRLDREHESILSAVGWCDHVEAGGLRELRLVWAMRTYWGSRGRYGLGLRVTRGALGRKGAEAPSPARARALDAAGYLAYFAGRYEEARRWTEESLSVSRALADPLGIARALELVSLAAFAQGEVAAARAYAEEAAARARALGDRSRLAKSLNTLAEICRAEEDLCGAASLYEESLALARETDDADNICVTLVNLAMVEIASGELETARRRLVESVGLAETLGSKRLGELALETAAGLAAAGREWVLAARFYGVADALLEKMGSRREPVDAQFHTLRIARARGELGDEAFGLRFAAGRALSYEDAVSETRAWLDRSASAPEIAPEEPAT